jgi:hypothetical protein
MTYRELLIPAVIVLLGFVMLLGGNKGGRIGLRIAVVFLGILAMFLVFGFIVGRAI